MLTNSILQADCHPWQWWVDLEYLFDNMARSWPTLRTQHTATSTYSIAGGIILVILYHRIWTKHYFLGIRMLSTDIEFRIYCNLNARPSCVVVTIVICRYKSVLWMEHQKTVDDLGKIVSIFSVFHIRNGSTVNHWAHKTWCWHDENISTW